MIVAMTIKDFCRRYGIGRTTAYELMRARTLLTRKSGGRTLITEESAKTWFESLPDARPAASAEAVE
jgi:hypothetical protein